LSVPFLDAQSCIYTKEEPAREPAEETDMAAIGGNEGTGSEEGQASGALSVKQMIDGADAAC
jgi:hypothetical protein